MGCPGVPPPPTTTRTRNMASAPASVSSGSYNPCPAPLCLGLSSLSLTPQSSTPMVATAMEPPASSPSSLMAPPTIPVPQMGAPMATAGVPPPPTLTRTRNTASAPTEVPAGRGTCRGGGTQRGHMRDLRVVLGSGWCSQGPGTASLTLHCRHGGDRRQLPGGPVRLSLHLPGAVLQLLHQPGPAGRQALVCHH